MACLPATQFACGFTVTCGVKFILLVNLALNVTALAMTVGHFIFGFQGMALLSSYPAEAFILAFSMAGIPIILMGFNGVLYRNEAQIRMYLYYMWIIIVSATFLILKELVFSGACTNLPDFLKREGSAWACGVARYIHIGLTVVSLSILCYFQHVVYSHCEDLAECGGGPDLADLVLNKEAYSKRYQPQNAYCSIQGMADLQDSGSLWETAILGGSGTEFLKGPQGVGGGQSIFGGKYHEMSYPSPHLGSASGGV